MSSPLRPYVVSGSTVYISGQVGLDLKTGVIPEDFESQIKLVFQNLNQVLTDAGLTASNVVKTTVYMTDLSMFEQMNAEYKAYFQSNKPARTAVGVAALPEFPGDPKVFIEIEAIAELDS